MLETWLEADEKQTQYPESKGFSSMSFIYHDANYILCTKDLDPHVIYGWNSTSTLTSAFFLGKQVLAEAQFFPTYFLCL